LTFGTDCWYAKMNPKISIGILAYNEERRIGATLRSVFAQDVFQQFETDVIIVANGCTDNTVAVATRSLEDYKPLWCPRGSARVEEVPIAGKANAWNQFVHDFSSRQASVLVLMDADIILSTNNTISSMVSTLERTPEAVVCVDRPVKDIAAKTKH